MWLVKMIPDRHSVLYSGVHAYRNACLMMLEAGSSWHECHRTKNYGKYMGDLCPGVDCVGLLEKDEYGGATKKTKSYEVLHKRITYPDLENFPNQPVSNYGCFVLYGPIRLLAVFYLNRSRKCNTIRVKLIKIII